MKKLRFLALVLLLAAALAASAWGGSGTFATTVLTVTSSAAVSIPANKLVVGGVYATEAFVSVENGPVRVWYSGNTPTTSAGHLLQAGQWCKLENSHEVANFQVIAVSATATVMVTLEWGRQQGALP